MALRLWPKDYDRKEHITKEEKYLLRFAAQSFKEGHFAVGIDPVGMSTDAVHMGMYIVPDKGLLTFSIYKDPIDVSMLQNYKFFVETVEEKIYERLIDSKMLIVRSGEKKFLKFPYKHVIVFANERASLLKGANQAIKTLSPYAYIGPFSRIGSSIIMDTKSALNIAFDARKPYDTGFRGITESESKAIFERLAPEYTVVMHEEEHVEVKQVVAPTKEQSFKITGKELEFTTFFLDEYQVAQVNDMGKGHRVLLANPGAGKSVLLLSKAFKYASLYKDSKVLLTCFNNNLADSYQFKRNCANFGDNRNLYIMTLHKLVKKLFEECLHKRCDSNIATPEEIDECLRKVRSGEIAIRFKAIFIDEVQIFEPVYLELCYALLERDEDATFLMAGDLNQTVRSQSRRGDAPWKKINGISLDFTGRVKYIEKNYRNSKQIGDFLNRMLCYMNKQMERLDMISSKEFEYDAFEPGDRASVAMNIRTGINRTQIQGEVISSIKEIVNKYKVGYSEIAVLFPYKENRALKYYFLYWLTSGLDKEGIPYSLITAPIDENQSKTTFSKTTGVVVSTIDSSLGLDFKAVIVAGLYPYNYVFSESGYRHQLSDWKTISKLPKDEKEKAQIQIRKLYTACSRARDVLYVLSDLDANSPMEQLLTEAEGK